MNRMSMQLQQVQNGLFGYQLRPENNSASNLSKSTASGRIKLSLHQSRVCMYINRHTRYYMGNQRCRKVRTNDKSTPPTVGGQQH